MSCPRHVARAQRKQSSQNFQPRGRVVGYVTVHYRAQLMNGGETIETSTTAQELFNMEYDDGDEEDMDIGEVSAAIALAAITE